MEKYCRTCGWAVPSNREHCLDCEWVFHNPTPVVLHYSQSYIHESDTYPCPCWKPKQENPCPEPGDAVS